MEWSTHDPSGSHRAGHEYISWQFARNHFSKRWNYHLAATIRRTCIRFWTKTTEAMRNCLYLSMKKNWERQCGRRGTSWMFNHRHPFSTFFGTAHRVSRRPGASNKGTTYPSCFAVSRPVRWQSFRACRNKLLKPSWLEAKSCRKRASQRQSGMR